VVNHLGKPEAWFEKLFQIRQELKALYDILDSTTADEEQVMARINELEKERD